MEGKQVPCDENIVERLQDRLHVLMFLKFGVWLLIIFSSLFYWFFAPKIFSFLQAYTLISLEHIKRISVTMYFVLKLYICLFHSIQIHLVKLIWFLTIWVKNWKFRALVRDTDITQDEIAWYKNHSNKIRANAVIGFDQQWAI